ncbi:hypothetical protein AB0J25_11855 [Streptomyces sp. NPDC049910]|uniref:hypothetical protein n=1 Tax=Streptomyces sp. NPDC049910 TaxID=3155278 RepID=UPI00344A0D73
MKIRMLTEMAGERDGEPWPKKGVAAELPTAVAAHLIASGVAEEIPKDRGLARKAKHGRGERDADVGSS